ncbi:MAG: FAD-binding and (Fe-S)-binding domain-containing protein, partial [Alphaproteobacteria bacterium]
MDSPAPPRTSNRIGDSRLAARLTREIEGDVLFDAFSRGRYSTDASIYQIEPIGVVVPRREDDIAAIIAIAAEEGVPVLPRGGGTSQCGQTVGEALVVDTSKHLNSVLSLDPEAASVTVQPGLVLDALNAYLRPHGLFFPIDPSTASRATLGGMAANNSCGGRSIRYGLTRDNVRAIDATLADGTQARFGPVPADLGGITGDPRYVDLVRRMRELGMREAGEIAARFPKLLRRVGGYNIDSISADGHNMAHLLVGSEGTLGFFRRLELAVHAIPPHKFMAVCHFESFGEAMEITRHIVELDPSAVELMDATMINLARDIPAYRPLVERFVRGEPKAILMVEFAGDDHAEQLGKLRELDALMADHGFPGAMLDAADPALQKDIMEVRKAGLNIMMSMKGDGKPVSFIEDCAVGLDDLAAYTGRLTEMFDRHGVEGTWYAHASVGCLHVRPVLNMKDGGDVKKMRDIAEEAFAMVREYKGSHSGEHGDGIVRSEFHTPMFGARIVSAFEEVKQAFDPGGLFNPGKIVRAPLMDDRSLFRYRPGYAPEPANTALDWGEWDGFNRAVEMCNNNGACRKSDPGVMCPSYRVTGDEEHVTRGRANALRLAITGQLGPGALGSDAMAAAMDLCIGCKACRRECPTGVDMARMKIEFLHARRKDHGISLRARLVAFLPRYAPWAARLAPLANVANRLRGMAGFSTRRALPRWRRDVFRPGPDAINGGREIVLLGDCFNSYFEPENARAAHRVLAAAGYEVKNVQAADGNRPLCCGRTFLSAGLVDQARAEAGRTIEALRPYVARGVPVIGLEPSCLLTLRDEYIVLLPGADTSALAAKAVLFEEFLAAESDAGRLDLALRDGAPRRAMLHGHCHQKSFGAMAAVEQALRLVPGLEVETIESGCCGMAGAFGFEAEHYDISMQIGETGLLPAVREAGDDVLIIADGTSCRQQIDHGA